MTQHTLHTDDGYKVSLGKAFTAPSRRRGGSPRTFIPITLATSDGHVVTQFSVDQENLLLRVAQATGSYIERPKPPAVYDGTQA